MNLQPNILHSWSCTSLRKTGRKKKPSEWKRTKFYSLVKVWFALRSECSVLLMFVRSGGTQQYFWFVQIHCITQISFWKKIIFFICIKLNISYITRALMPLLWCPGMLHKSIESVCSSASLPLPKPFACPHTHTLTFFHQLWDTKITYKRLSAPPHP